MRKKLNHLFLPLILAVAGLALVYTGLMRPVTIRADGSAKTIFTRAITVRGALMDAGIEYKVGDRVYPGISDLIGFNPAITYSPQKFFQVWTAESGFSGQFSTNETIPGNLLLQAGIRIFPGDKIRWNGAVITPEKPLPTLESLVLQFQPAKKIILERDSLQRVIFSSASTVGQALWENGIPLSISDNLTPAADQTLYDNMEITLMTARPISIQVGEKTVSSLSAASTTGTALQDAGVVLQGQDYSIPPESEPLPENRTIRVVRVTEEILLNQTNIPFETEYVQDPETGLDQESVIQPGVSGIKISSQRVRYENGLEVSRTKAEEWLAQEPVNAKIGYGSKIIPYTLETPEGTIEYYRAVPVYATSYSPCRSGTEACLSGTSLGLPLKKGIIGVTYEWFILLGGHEVYVPGYGRGVIADVGGGIDGKRWIDLGFSDDDYVHWSQDTTLYFLTPAPPDVPWILP